MSTIQASLNPDNGADQQTFAAKTRGLKCLFINDLVVSQLSSASRFWVTEADLWSMSSLGRAGSCSFSHQIYSTFLQLSKISSILLTPGCNRKQPYAGNGLGWPNENRCDQLFIKFPHINRESKKPPPGTIQEYWPNSGPSPQKGWWFLHWWSGCTGLYRLARRGSSFFGKAFIETLLNRLILTK